MEVGILLMGGSGVRCGGEAPKQFQEIGGKSVYLHTLETFLDSNLFDGVILVCPSGWIDLVRKETAPFTNVIAVLGGQTRQESSFKGLLACPKETKIVVIHDAVRPFVSRKILEKNLEAARLYGAVDTCIPSADTIVRSEDGKTISEIPARAHYLRGQTPQSFSYSLIYEAHRRTSRKNASDDCCLVLEMGLPVAIVEGDERNIKITDKIDLVLASSLFSMSKTDIDLPEKLFAAKKKRSDPALRPLLFETAETQNRSTS